MAEDEDYDKVQIKMATLEANVKQLNRQFYILNTALFGNGQKGIKEKLDNLIGGINAFKYMGGGGGFAGIVALIITIIVSIRGGI